MVTIAILGVIVSIAIPAYRNYIANSRNTEGWNNLAGIKLAQEEYFLENNTYFPPGNATVKTSDGSIDIYWTAAEGNDRNFDYAVTTSNGSTSYTATATGRGAGYDVPDTVTFSVNK
jgi:type IV pilus assembly protein PilE